MLNALIPPVRLVGLERVEKANVWLTERFFRGAGGDYEKVEQLREDGPRVTTDEFAKVVRSMARFHERSVDLSAIEVPTLVVYGENDLPFARRHAAAIATQVADVEVAEIADAGHASNLDDPGAFSDLLRSLLFRVGTADDAVGTTENVDSEAQ